MLCEQSEYFRAAFNEKWREHDEGLTLEDVEPNVFDLFIHWLYTRNVPGDWNGAWLSVAAGHTVDESYENATTMEHMLQLKVCVFADRFLVPALKKAVHNFFINDHSDNSSAPRYEIVIYAFKNLPENDKILDYLVAKHVVKWNATMDQGQELELRQDLSRDFLLRVMVGYGGREKSNELVACDYHIHDSDEERENCKWWQPPT